MNVAPNKFFCCRDKKIMNKKFCHQLNRDEAAFVMDRQRIFDFTFFQNMTLGGVI